MHAYQRPHVPSDEAIAKRYRFIELALDLDLDALLAELREHPLPWQPSQWKWHRGTYFCVLRGGPGGAGPASELVTGTGHDAPILARLPRFAALLDEGFASPVPLAWLGLSPTQAVIRAHVDNTAHWDEHHRIHVPLISNRDAVLCVDGRCQHFAPGSAWAINNSVVHGARNGMGPRVHLILDLPPSPAVEAWLAAGRACEGVVDHEALRVIGEDPLADLDPEQLTNYPLYQVMAKQ